MTALGLTQIVDALNRGMDHAGSPPIGVPTRFSGIGVCRQPSSEGALARRTRADRTETRGGRRFCRHPAYLRGRCEDHRAVSSSGRSKASSPCSSACCSCAAIATRSFCTTKCRACRCPKKYANEFGPPRADERMEGIAVARERVSGALARTPGVAGAYVIAQDHYEGAAEAIFEAATRALDTRDQSWRKCSIKRSLSVRGFTSLRTPGNAVRLRGRVFLS